jgi:hypothetical protein
MSLPLLFWVIYIISVLFGFWSSWPIGPANAKPLSLILIGLLGWQVFGAAVHK